MPPLFPPIEPYTHAWLDVSDGHRVYYEESGNPSGIPALFVHGGPGSGCNADQRRFFDPACYRIILFDQRGTGRSLPFAAVEVNDTPSLVADMESLRARLGIEKWVLFGGSWGSALSLAYAEQYPERVLGLVLRGVFLCREKEIDWYLYGLRTFVPEAWERFAGFLPEEERNDLLGAYQLRLWAGDSQACLSAARAWNEYETFIMALGSAGGPAKPPPEDHILLGKVRIQVHYLTHRCFFRENQLLDRIGALHDIPAAIVQGRFDLVCPPITAYQLHCVWPRAELTLVNEAGHPAFHPPMASALVRATERLKDVVGAR